LIEKSLTVLQEDVSLSVAEIGTGGLSSTPCWKRIQKLEAEGIIQSAWPSLTRTRSGSA